MPLLSYLNLEHPSHFKKNSRRRSWLEALMSGNLASLFFANCSLTWSNNYRAKELWQDSPIGFWKEKRYGIYQSDAYWPNRNGDRYSIELILYNMDFAWDQTELKNVVKRVVLNPHCVCSRKKTLIPDSEKLSEISLFNRISSEPHQSFCNNIHLRIESTSAKKKKFYPAEKKERK